MLHNGKNAVIANNMEAGSWKSHRKATLVDGTWPCRRTLSCTSMQRLRGFINTLTSSKP